MGRRIIIIDSHPDPDRQRFVHGLADAYASAAEAAGHMVRRLTLAELDIPILHDQQQWLHGPPAPEIAAWQETIGWAQHLVFLYPLWLGDMPALLKAFLEQVFRPGFAFQYREKGFPAKLLQGRSARIIMTMGMPAFAYRLFFRAHSLKSFKRNILHFTGIAPVRTTLIGGIESSADARSRWLETVRRLGRAAR